MKYLFPYLCSVILFCCACSSADTEVVTSFPKTGVLKAQVKKVPVPFLLPRFMGAMDDRLLVYKDREDTLFQFFALPSCEYIGSAGTRGQGPDDFGMPDTRSFYMGDSTFSFVEAGSNLFKTVSCQGRDLKVTKTESFLTPGIPSNGIYPLADSVYLTQGNLVGDDEFCLFDRKTSVLTPMRKYPEWTDMETGVQVYPSSFAYIKTCVVSPDKQCFAAFYGYFKRFRIFDSQVRLLHDVQVNIEPCETRFRGPEGVSQQPVYYMGQPQAVGNYIYALCSNANGSGLQATSRPELHVFDWEGHPVACYEFDRRVSLFAISPKYHLLVALDNRIPDELFLYDLPEL